MMFTLRFGTLKLATWCFWGVVVASTLLLSHRVAPVSVSSENLDTLVPTSFGAWQVIPNGSTIVNPQVQARLDAIYDQTLSRTYINQANGRHIMLSLAYGSNQSHATQLHKPEACYPSQGFKIDSLSRTAFRVAGRDIPVTTLHASLGTRSEYISYWMVEGDRVVRGALQQNLQRSLLALRGIVGSGLLFRVSEISTDERSSFTLQREFADSLVNAITFPQRTRLFGSSAFTAMTIP